MTFLWPSMLWLLLAIPLLVAAYFMLLRRRTRAALRYPSLRLLREALGRGRHWRRHLPPILMLLAICAALIAVARPVADITLPQDQQTIMLAMDVSLSMRADDVEPSRIEAAQAAARGFVQDLPGRVRVGIVTFAGTASLVQAPTRDREPLIAAIDRFQLQRATAVGSGILLSLATLFPDDGIDLEQSLFGTRATPGGPSESNAQGSGRSARGPDSATPLSAPAKPGSHRSGVIVLLTDGRTTTGPDPLQAARLAAERGVRVFTVGFGTPGGATVSFGGFSMFMRFDEETLKAIAQITDAEYFQAGSAESLKRVYADLGSRLALEARHTELGALFAAAAAVLATLAAALSYAWFQHRT